MGGGLYNNPRELRLLARIEKFPAALLRLVISRENSVRNASSFNNPPARPLPASSWATVLAWGVGIAAAYLLSVTVLGLEGSYGLRHLYFYVDEHDVWLGCIKALFFGGVIALVGCYRGLNCGEGAEGVGRATNEAVVQSCIAILVSNFFLTLLLRGILYP